MASRRATCRLSSIEEGDERDERDGVLVEEGDKRGGVRRFHAGSPRDVGTNNAPEWRRVRDWPAQQWPPHQEARGKLLLKCSPDDRRAARAVCSIQDGVLSLTVAIQNGQGEGSSSSVVQSPVGELAVGLRRSRTSMFILAKLVENKVCDKIYCFAENHSERNKWTAVFRRMGIPIFDVHSKRHAKAVSSGVH